MAARMSRSTSRPGATSVSSSPSGAEAEHAAVGDVEHGLAAFRREAAAEGAVLDLLHEFRIAARGEGAEEDDLLGVLADVDEAAGAGQPRPELADVDVALAVDLRHAEEGRVEAAAVVEVELRGLVHQRLDVARRAEVEAAGRQAADRAGLGGERQVFEHPLLVGDARHALPACRCRG